MKVSVNAVKKKAVRVDVILVRPRHPAPDVIKMPVRVVSALPAETSLTTVAPLFEETDAPGVAPDARLDTSAPVCADTATSVDSDTSIVDCDDYSTEEELMALIEAEEARTAARDAFALEGVDCSPEGEYPSDVDFADSEKCTDECTTDDESLADGNKYADNEDYYDECQSDDEELTDEDEYVDGDEEPADCDEYADDEDYYDECQSDDEELTDGDEYVDGDVEPADCDEYADDEADYDESPSDTDSGVNMRYFDRAPSGERVEVARDAATGQEVVFFDKESGRLSRVCGIIKNDSAGQRQMGAIPTDGIFDPETPDDDTESQS